VPGQSPDLHELAGDVFELVRPERNDVEMQLLQPLDPALRRAAVPREDQVGTQRADPLEVQPEGIADARQRSRRPDLSQRPPRRPAP
jgi:hypothetical protein